MSGWVGGCRQTFFISLLLQFLSISYESWHVCSMCPYGKKTGTDFQNFAVKVFGEFFKFLIETHSVEKRK